jgi:DNA-binding LytR/AlgR family response regulator
MNLNIAICDDEVSQIEYLTKLTRDWAILRSINVNIHPFESAEAFLFFYANDKSNDILLLDIQMKEMDGITLAKKIRQNNGQIQIIFITALTEFISEGYEVSALHYLLKPVSREKLDIVLDKAVLNINRQETPILIETADATARVLLSEIKYIEAFAHNTQIHMTDGTNIKGLISISELISLLGNGFCRVHRSYLVGLAHIRQIGKTNIIMDGGLIIPMSRRRYNEVNQAFIKYHKG